MSDDLSCDAGLNKLAVQVYWLTMQLTELLLDVLWCLAWPCVLQRASSATYRNLLAHAWQPRQVNALVEDCKNSFAMAQLYHVLTLAMQYSCSAWCHVVCSQKGTALAVAAPGKTTATRAVESECRLFRHKPAVQKQPAVQEQPAQPGRLGSNTTNFSIACTGFSLYVHNTSWLHFVWLLLATHLTSQLLQAPVKIKKSQNRQQTGKQLGRPCWWHLLDPACTLSWRRGFLWCEPSRWLPGWGWLR